MLYVDDIFEKLHMIRNAYAYMENCMLMHFIVTWPPERSHEVHIKRVDELWFGSGLQIKRIKKNKKIAYATHCQTQ